jgi:predicted ATPase
VLEDLHWSDRSSLELLGFIAHGLRETPTMLVAHLDELAELLAARLDREPDPALVERVMAWSEGN